VEIIGKLISKLELQSGIGKTGNSWQKQEFVIETIEQFPKKVCANLWGDKIDALAALAIGDTVVVTFNLESREFNGKWYTDVRAWKIEKQGVQPASPSVPTTASNEPSGNDFPTTFVDEGVTDDLPF
jgi:hypothetical protein